MPIDRVEFHKPSNDTWVGESERDPADEDAVRLIGTPKGDLTFNYPPGSSWTQSRMDSWKAAGQQLLDTRIPVADFPPDHPWVKDGDPGLEFVFWDGNIVVIRPLIIEELVADPDYKGTGKEALVFALRRPKMRGWVY